MTNRHLAVRWDGNGAITSIIALDAARELLPAGHGRRVLELAPDRPVRYDAWDLESWTPGLATRCSMPTRSTCSPTGPLLGRVAVERRFGPSSRRP